MEKPKLDSVPQRAIMPFMLLDCQPLDVASNKLGGILAPAQYEMPASENDVETKAKGLHQVTKLII